MISQLKGKHPTAMPPLIPSWTREIVGRSHSCLMHPCFYGYSEQQHSALSKLWWNKAIDIKPYFFHHLQIPKLSCSIGSSKTMQSLGLIKYFHPVVHFLRGRKLERFYCPSLSRRDVLIADNFLNDRKSFSESLSTKRSLLEFIHFFIHSTAEKETRLSGCFPVKTRKWGRPVLTSKKLKKKSKRRPWFWNEAVRGRRFEFHF